MGLKILVIGIGAVGAVVTKLLADDDNVESIICGDIDLERAKKFLTFDSKKVKLVYLDAKAVDDIALCAKDINLIINTSLPKLNLNIMNAALKVGAHYQDLCSEIDEHYLPEQLKLSEKFAEKKLVGLINTGMAPGVTNLLVKDLSINFDEIDLVKIRTLQDQVSINPIFALSPEIILEEAMVPAVKFENGKFVALEQFSEFEDFEFKDDYFRFVYAVHGDEVITLPKYLPVKNVSFMAGGTDIESMKSIFDLGLLSTEPITVSGSKIIPLDLISQVPIDIPSPSDMSDMIKKGVFKSSEMLVVVELFGKKFGKSFKARSLVQFYSVKEINSLFEGANYISFSTGFSAYCFSKIIFKLNEFGVFPPEHLDYESISMILSNLIANGLKIKKTFSN